GAANLFLGFTENYGFGNPAILPGYYSDNGGSLSVDVEGMQSTLGAMPTLTALRVSTASAVTGQSGTLTARVRNPTAGGPTPSGGTVTFSDQAGTIGTANLVNGVAELTTTSLPAGTDTIAAAYGGTAIFAPSTAGTNATLTVGSSNALPTLTALVA